MSIARRSHIPKVPFVGQLIREQRKQHQWLQWATPGHRWLDWARSLVEGYEHITARYRTPAMAFVRPLMLYHMLRERWLVSSRRFYQQMRLIIYPILRDTVWRQRFSVEQIHSTSSVENRLNTRFLTGVLSTGHEFIFPKMRAEWRVPALHIPLPIVFQRLRQIEEVIKTYRWELTSQKNALPFVHRIFQQTQRTEKNTINMSVFYALRKPGIRDHQSSSLPTTKRSRSIVEEPGGQDTLESKSLNLEVLTNQVIKQIDRRIIAWRERMGKI